MYNVLLVHCGFGGICAGFYRLRGAPYSTVATIASIACAVHSISDHTISSSDGWLLNRNTGAIDQRNVRWCRLMCRPSAFIHACSLQRGIETDISLCPSASAFSFHRRTRHRTEWGNSRTIFPPQIAKRGLQWAETWFAGLRFEAKITAAFGFYIRYHAVFYFFFSVIRQN